MTDRLPEEPTPVPVAITEVSAPVPVVVTASEPPKRQEPTVASVDREKLKSEGQRRVNIIWEGTQSVIALGVIFTTLFVNAAVALNASAETIDQLSAVQSLNVMAALVTGFYFSRTNHQAIGGIGEKDDAQEYKGR